MTFSNLDQFFFFAVLESCSELFLAFSSTFFSPASDNFQMNVKFFVCEAT